VSPNHKKLNAETPERIVIQATMNTNDKHSNPSEMTDYKKKTIVFRRIDEFELDYAEWYSNKKDDFKTEADALKQWAAMIDGTDGKAEERENEEEYGWEQVEEQCDEIQQEYETDNYDQEMMNLVESAVDAFGELGVRFYKDHSCCNTCGHSEAREENYVFYHGQDTDRLRKGDRSVHLAFSFDEETKKKVLKMIEEQTMDAIRLHWAGEDHTKIFLTCDDDLMAAHIKEDAERQVRMAKIEAEKAEKARVVIEAEMKAKGIPTLDELIEFIKREGKDSPLVKEMNAKFQEAIKKNEA